ncbi:hypothetical protein LVJ94_34650 [Pendulispora rubella]|uniref:Uncharacterized protein n=1 Tax=Pendulispora rubella TaxID=2741070 RepID=A0ABZ2KYH4_9BACT
MKIVIQELKEGGRSWTRESNESDRNLAINHVVASIWGKRAFFWQDSELSFGYGQIMRPIGGDHSTSVTDRVRVDVE